MISAATIPAPPPPIPSPAWEAADALLEAFGAPFKIFELDSASVVCDTPELPPCDAPWLVPLLEAACHASGPQFLADEDSVVLLALPLGKAMGYPAVAFAPFVTRHVQEESLVGPARVLRLPEARAAQWINSHGVWPPPLLERLGREVLRRLHAQRREQQLQQEVRKVSGSLAACFQEISLLHSVSQSLRLSSSDEEIGGVAIQWLLECIPAQGIALLYLPVASDDTTFPARTEPHLQSAGQWPFVSPRDVLQIVDQIDVCRYGRPAVVNQDRAELPPGIPPQIRQIVLAPMAEGNRIFGYLIAINHARDEEFGTVEANLMASLSAMLGVHCSNRDLYRQQDEFLASVVRALTSAIDAKDPYTCGHSDRVARIASRLAQQLGRDRQFVSTIYMAGLLHDIGKIGIDDAVLRKAGRLTPAEFEHIKQHPELGCKILADIKQFADVLPAVLHHHEQWDGRGYPSHLAGEQIPLLARIVAVADAYDAMTSFRPYRSGMSEEKVLEIFRQGAGQQWDAAVIEAFLDTYDDIRSIAQEEHSSGKLEVRQWLV